MKNSIVIKALTLGVVGLLLFAVLSMIQGVIAERQDYRDQTIASVSQSIAEPQTLLGPLIYQSCTEAWTEKTIVEGKETKTKEKREFTLVSMPQHLTITSSVGVEQRSRALYHANVLNTKAVLKAQFAPYKALTPEPEQADSKIQCATPVMMMALDDPRGIRSSSAHFNGQALTMEAGTGHSVYKRGMRMALPVDKAKTNDVWEVELALQFAATQRLSFVPIGENTEINLHSDWPHPSFNGRFAPIKPSITDQGFEAQWRVTSLASNAIQTVSENLPICSHGGDGADKCVEIASVDFIEPINAYFLSHRAAKYGLLFVALTFVAVGMFEVMKKRRVHPVQYLLVGAAICTFFLLLVSLGEHIGFTGAYAAGAAATTLLLTYYASHMLGGWLRGLPFGAMIALLYGMLFALLQLEQTALVMGALVLFAVLAAVMVLTRKVDWYSQLGAGAGLNTPHQTKGDPHA